MRVVRDDPANPDPGFAELYASLPDATDLEPWLGWCRQSRGTVLYLGVGAGRLAVPLQASGVAMVGVDSHPEMLARLRSRAALELVQDRIEDLHLGRRFELVMAPSNILYTRQRLAAAARHAERRVAFELVNPHWLRAGAGSGVRLRAATDDRAEIEVDYEGGFTQLASVELIRPDSVEEFLKSAGLELETMHGHEGDGMDDSPSFFVLARR